MKPNKNQSIPPEFLPENVQANSSESEQLFTHLLKVNEPFQSLEKQGLVFTPSPSGGENGVDLNDDSLYYNTQGSAKEYWKKMPPSLLRPRRLNNCEMTSANLAIAWSRMP